MKEHSKVIFLLTSLFSPMQFGGRNMHNFQIFAKNRKFFEVLKWYEMEFALWKSVHKWFFVYFFHLCSMGVDTCKKFEFLTNIFKFFWSPTMVWNGFCAITEHSKLFCVDFFFFTYAVWGSKHTKLSNFSGS